MISYLHVVISGGAGKRLWPLSRENFPKPYIHYNDAALSLFQQTIYRHANAKNRLIITNEHLYYQSHHQLRVMSPSVNADFLLESNGKNTGPAICLAALHANPDDLMVVTPADHLIASTDQYQKTLQEALELTIKTNGVVLIGIQPTAPSTEYGYIQTNGTNVSAFKEKPHATLAESYLQSGNYYWNSGIFCFKASTIINAFKTHAPSIFNAADIAYQNKDGQRVDTSTIPEGAFDRVILEVTDNIHMVHNQFNWSDIGSFDEFQNHLASPAAHITVNSSNTTAYSTKTVAFHDVSDVYVVESNDAILVGKKGHSSSVSDVVSEVKKHHPMLLKESKQVYRPWGHYTILFESSTYKVKRILVYPKHRLSLQKHNHRSEHWTCVSGETTVTNGDTKLKLGPNESIYIPQGTLHRIENDGDSNVEIIEVQCGSYLGEDDIIRIESDY
jgi:mannose-1-phosphate guanylyltransferase